MEEYSHSEHVTGSPTAGESGFVHVESIDSASMDDSAINQDDGVVVTRVDNVQDDGGNEEFVDCPDDLLSYDEKTDFDASQESEAVSEVNQHTSFENEREILPHHYQEERQQLMTELTNLRHKLKLLIKKHPLIDGNEGALFTYEHATETVAGDDMDKSLWPLHEVIFDCSRFIELALSEQSQTEHTVRELLTTLDTKDKEINALNVIVTEHHSLETTTDRILNSLGVKVEDFSHTSVSGKMSHLEKSISFLTENRNHFFSEVQMLNKGLTELKRKEVELINKSGHLENEYRKLMEHFEKGRETIKMLNSEIGRLKGESEVDKTKYNNTREKLNMAVTKGKSLVQQRDSLKQAVAEKTSELDKCLVNLQEKSTLANLLEDEYLTLQDEIKTIKEAASVKIDFLISSLVMETQKRSYLEDEFTDLTQKFQELCVLKDKNVCLKIDLQRSEDKCGLLREKLSMAVKKGQSLVQEREIMKQQISEKNSHIDALRLDLKNQEDRISKLESDLLHSKQERDKIEELLVESNTILQKVIDTTNEFVLPNDIKDPVEKVKWCGVYLKENQFSKAQIEQELRDVKDALLVSEKNVSQLTEEKSKLENVKTQIEEELQESSRTIKSLEDTLSVSEKTVSELTSEKSKLENVKSQIEEELQESSKTIKSLEDTLVVSEKNVSQLTSEKSKLENVKTQIEEELEESSKTIKSLEDTLSVSEKNVSELTSEKSKLESLKTQIEEKLQESSKTIKSLEDNVSELTSEKSKLENVKSQIEEELQESSKTIKSLENTVSQLQTQVSNFSHESEKKNLKDEVTYHESETIQTLQDSLLNANNTVSNLLEEKTNANIQLSTCKQELDLSSQILTDEFIRFSSLIDGIITSMLIKMEGIKNTIPVTLEQAKSLQKNIHDLEAELDKNRSTNEKVKEENHMLQNIVSKMETESQTMRDEMVIKLKGYQAKEDEWNRREAELSNQLKHHEIQRDVTEASTQSEISEVEDQVSIGKRSISLRKGSNDHFALDIDQESDRLINKQETVEDKGHVFKSLHTSGLVPPQGKVIADRLDGIWVSGGGALMSRPKARLGVIAYWLLLHLWLLGTLL